ncbi:hypothetical protein DdX_22435 [Ditylenchus destructor]|uniref:Uncharacterized protein n=1 Tax=Ditylenchus destructor TaxID=166010 RepID=A0AAD4MDM7_9BILA|nr:hypothetical protein DdX_22435 [Ditylenchus destructor]
MAKDVRLTLRLTVTEPTALAAIALQLADARGGRCEVVLDAPLPSGGEAELVLGRNFRIDGELAARIEGLPPSLPVSSSPPTCRGWRWRVKPHALLHPSVQIRRMCLRTRKPVRLRRV